MRLEQLPPVVERRAFCHSEGSGSIKVRLEGREERERQWETEREERGRQGAERWRGGEFRVERERRGDRGWRIQRGERSGGGEGRGEREGKEFGGERGAEVESGEGKEERSREGERWRVQSCTRVGSRASGITRRNNSGRIRNKSGIIPKSWE